MSGAGYYPQNLKYVLALAALASTTVAVYLIYKELRAVKADVIELKRRSVQRMLDSEQSIYPAPVSATWMDVSSLSSGGPQSSGPSTSAPSPPEGSQVKSPPPRHVHFSEDELMGCPHVQNMESIPLRMPNGDRLCIPIVNSFKTGLSTIEEITEVPDVKAAPAEEEEDPQEVSNYWRRFQGGGEPSEEIASVNHAPFPQQPTLVKSVMPCEEIIKSGKRKGELCGRDSISSDNKCRIHSPKEAVAAEESIPATAPDETV